MDLESRIQARLAKERQLSGIEGSGLEMASLGSATVPPKEPNIQYTPLTQAPVKASTIALQQSQAQSSMMPTALNPTVAQMSNELDVTAQNFNDAQRELAQTRSRMFSQERQLSTYENELKQKDAALRRTLAEATGERTALVESLAQSRAEVDSLKIELEQKTDLLQKSEAKLTKFSEDFQEIEEKYIKVQQELEEYKFNSQHFKETQNLLEVKNNILQSENEKLSDEIQQLTNTELESKVLKQNLSEIQHEFAALSNKYEKECENNKNIRAEYLNLKQEYSVMLQKFADSEDEYNSFKQLKLKYEETCKQYNEVSEKFRAVSEKNEEAEIMTRQLSGSLEDEKNAGNSISELMLDALNNATSQDSVISDMEKLSEQINNVQLTNTYQKFAPVLSKARSLAAQSSAFEKHVKELDETNNVLEKENAVNKAKITEEQLQIDNISTSNERLNEALKEQTNECQEKSLLLQKLDEEHERLVLDVQLALNQINSLVRPDSPLPATVENIQAITAQLTTVYNANSRKAEETAEYVDRLQTENTNLSLRIDKQTEALRGAEELGMRLKQELNASEEGLQQSGLQLGELRAQQNNLSQFLQLLLREVNQADRRANLLCQQSTISNTLLMNYLVEQHTLRTEGATKTQLARLKLRKVVYAVIFANKLARSGRQYAKELAAQVTALSERTDGSHENMLNQTNQMLAPVIGQSGNLTHGLQTLSHREQRDLVTKVLTHFFEPKAVVQCFAVQPFNAKTGQFTFFKSYFTNMAHNHQARVDELNLQLTEANKQNNVLQISVQEYKRDQEIQLDTITKKEQDIVRLRNGIEQFYVEKREYDQLALQKEDLENKLSIIENQSQDKTRQITSMEVDIQTFQNEITRLNDQLAQNDKLVKTITAKYDSQVQTQAEMKELVLNYEQQIKQKENKVEEMERRAEEERASKEAMQHSLDSNIQQMSELRTQLEQRDRLISDLQLQIEKENRLRVISEQQLLREKEKSIRGGPAQAVPRYDLSQQYNIQPASASMSMVPTAVNVSKPAVTIPKMQSATYNTKREIKDLINQLNTTFDEEL